MASLVKIKRLYLLPVLLITTTLAGYSQDSGLSSDELFQEARKAAFDRKDYQAAIALSQKALEKSPDYADIRIFLGRVYTWSDKPDSARTAFTRVLQKDPANEDVSLAFGNLEFWNNRSDKALSIADAGLSHHPESKDLHLLRAKALNDLRRFNEANRAVLKSLQIDPRNTEARALSSRIKDNSSGNSIGIDYEFIHFDKQFDDPWQLAGLSYGRQTRLGSVNARLNYANRFRESGLQVEMEAYPRISRTFYAYLGAGYSPDQGIFPEYRAGLSLYANLPASFEAEAGLRFLHFSDNTTVYTFSAGKYYRNYWFNFRTYLTPSNQNISQSYSLTTRFYYGGADDYISLGAGTGISPDDNQNNILLYSGYRLKSHNISLGYRHAIKNRHILILGSSWQNQEYARHTWGNQFNVSAGYQRRF